MGQIVGGLGTSHSPSMAAAFDKALENDPKWKPLFDGYGPARQWLKDQRPDLLIIFYNDHMDRFSLDTYPTFAIGVGDRFPVIDEGWGRRAFPDLEGDVRFADHVVRSLVRDEFDPMICHELSLDHGVLSPMPYLSETYWPTAILPIAVNVLHEPLPSVRRLHKMGQSLRRAVEAYDDDYRVVVFGTGGLSHHLNGTGFGWVNPDWDNYFLDCLEGDPSELLDYSHEDYMRLGGLESVEMMMWLGMRGALTDRVRCIHRNYHAPEITGFGLLVLEDA